MELKEIMAAFGAEIGIADLSADEDGVYAVDIDGMIVSFAEDREGGRLVTFAEIGEPPQEGREHIYRLLLETMHQGGETGGATFTVSPDSGTVCLRRSDPLESMTPAGFATMLEAFVNALEDWREAIVDFRDVGPAIDVAKRDAVAERRRFGMGEDGFVQV